MLRQIIGNHYNLLQSTTLRIYNLKGNNDCCEYNNIVGRVYGLNAFPMDFIATDVVLNACRSI